VVTPKKPRVAVLVRRFLATGGAERYAVEVTKRLAKQYDVTVFSEEVDSDLIEDIKHESVMGISKKPRHGAYRKFSDLTAPRLSGFDLVHSHERIMHGDIVTLHCPCFRSFRLLPNNTFRYWRERMNEVLLPRYRGYGIMEKEQFLGSPTRHFIVPSSYVEDNVRALYSLTHERFSLAPPGVDKKLFDLSISLEDVAQMRLSWHVPTEATLFLFVGTEFKRKGLDTLLKAMVHLPNSHLLVAGGGHINKFRSFANNLGLAKRVTFLGIFKEMPKLYACCDAMVLPTRVDPFGMAPLEAMAAGKPTILTGPKFCGLSRELKEGEALFIDDPDDVSKLKSAMLALNNRDLSQSIAKNGRERARTFTWENTAQQTAKAYESILSKKLR